MKFICGRIGIRGEVRQYFNAFSFIKSSFKSWSIVFFGSDSFSMASLVGLHKQIETNVIQNIEVVTKNCETPVYKFATSKNIKTHIWPPTLSGSYDFGVIASFGQFIPKQILDQFPLGIINVHASLLPRWRGGMPVVHTLKNGDTETGVTVLRINSDKFDTGEIVLQRTCSIGKDELMPSLYNRLSVLGWECLLEVVSTMPDCLKNSVPQSSEGVTLAPRLKNNSSVVKWNEMTAVEVYNLYRALFSLFKITTIWKGRKVNLICMSLVDDNGSSSTGSRSRLPLPGSFEYNKHDQCLRVQCKDRPIRICTLFINGKLYSALNFYKGFVTQESGGSHFDNTEV